MTASADLVRVELYRQFVERGRAPTHHEVARALQLPPVDVEQAFRDLHDAHVIVLVPGSTYIWMANPLSAVPTPYEVDAAGRDLYGNCIWDALGIVAMLGGSGSVTTSCPDCGERLSLDVEDGRANDRGYVVHYAVPAAKWWADIGAT